MPSVRRNILSHFQRHSLYGTENVYGPNDRRRLESRETVSSTGPANPIPGPTWPWEWDERRVEDLDQYEAGLEHLLKSPRQSTTAPWNLETNWATVWSTESSLVKKLPYCSLTASRPMFEYEPYQEGDVVIGGLISVHDVIFDIKNSKGNSKGFRFCDHINLDNYRAFLGLIFAVNEINKDRNLLPNVTLGYHIGDTCGDPKETLHYTLQILSGPKKTAPNYSCMERGELVAFIGDSEFLTSHALAQLLNLYKYTQINYDVSDHRFNDRELYPRLYRVVPDDRVRYDAIIQCLKYFGWNWIGIITASDGSGDMEYTELRKMMARHKICIEFVIVWNKEGNFIIDEMNGIGKYKSGVIVVCGLFLVSYFTLVSEPEFMQQNFTLILHNSWLRVPVKNFEYEVLINNSLLLILPDRTIPKIDTFINNINPTNTKEPMLDEIWITLFTCLSKDQRKNNFFQSVHQFTAVNCTDPTPLALDKSVRTKTYYTYTIVRLLAHILHNMNLRSDQARPYKLGQKINYFLKKVHYMDHNGEDISFNEQGSASSPWTLVNWVVVKSGDMIDFILKPLASFNETTKDNLPNINNEEIRWRNGRFNSEFCYKCPEDEWPDEKKVKCVPKTHEFLSYEKDILVLIFSALTSLFSIVTLFILGIFIHYWDTPIVKANNRTVSFILLVSILLSFLCVFLFLGCPSDITCLLRQMLFGIFFSISVSSVLGKTITVCIAFKATKPGSSWVKWVSLKVSNYVVVTCSSVQILLCVLWMLVSPPYVEFNHLSNPGKIVIQCNEGSDLWFYSMLGYMGLLAAVSFLLAFMVRTLPDSFNEAKYITFSMLLFCSVWIAMIPAYLSTSGKYMVAVEIFAILTSCAGVLGCIFVPKLYIMIFRPELNTRKIILQK
ncbi:vomeronasal type-2 receptor 26-like [Leptodactylus fuscus]|uniref:vomeronasal type-2 receptor 26-like n=1 Tax=Leptodactylus fuscus TaxID=238119 RepID=UPI003F4EA05C